MPFYLDRNVATCSYHPVLKATLDATFRLNYSNQQ
jgi:hypothetical protein